MIFFFTYILKDFMEVKEEGFGLFNVVFEFGEKFFFNILNDGREIIRYELRFFRENWELFNDSFNDI